MRNFIGFYSDGHEVYDVQLFETADQVDKAKQQAKEATDGNIDLVIYPVGSVVLMLENHDDFLNALRRISVECDNDNETVASNLRLALDIARNTVAKAKEETLPSETKVLVARLENALESEDIHAEIQSLLDHIKGGVR